MIDLEEIKTLDDRTLIELYQKVKDHIHYLENSIIDLSSGEEGEEDGEADE